MESVYNVKKGLYRHFKGENKIYEVLGTAMHTETEEELVIYRALYDDKMIKNGDMFARPIKMFLEEVPKDKKNPTGQKYRFEFIK